MTRPGWFGIGVYHPKKEVNVGTLYRSAASLGARFTFSIGERFQPQASDTCKSWRLIPHLQFADFDAFMAANPFQGRVVGVELDASAVPLDTYVHPPQAIYLLGAEDHGLPPAVLNRCVDTVQIPGRYCLNVAVAGSIAMYDRITKGAS